MSVDAAIFLSSWGWIGAEWTANGLYRLTFPRETKEQVCRDLGQPLTYNDRLASWALRLSIALEQYFTAEKQCFDIPIDYSDYTVFQRQVLQYIEQHLPFGSVTSYGQLATVTGHPRAARAIGQVMHANRTPIIVPCHRVLTSRRTLGGFGGGLMMKRKLLDLEQVNISALF